MAGSIFDWRVLYFAGSVCVICAAILLWHGRQQDQNTFRYYAPADKFQILKRFPDGFNYQFRWIHTENGTVSKRFIHAHFCEGFMPPFSAGETLTYLAYRDVGSCFLIQGQGLGYDFELDSRGHDSLAPNCHEGSRGYVECEPVLNEAVFTEE
jgi:hypothetical protein